MSKSEAIDKGNEARDFYQSDTWKVIKGLLNERYYNEFLATRPEEAEKREKIHLKVSIVKEIEEVMRAMHMQAEQLVREARK